MFKGKEIKLENVSVRLGRFSAMDGTSFSIDVTDRDSGCELVRLVIEETSEGIGNLFGNGIAKASGSYWNSDKIGKIQECDRAMIPFDPGLSLSDRLNAVIIKAREMYPDWEVDPERTWNGHRVSDNTYRVTIRRWVDAGNGKENTENVAEREG